MRTASQSEAVKASCSNTRWDIKLGPHTISDPTRNPIRYMDQKPTNPSNGSFSSQGSSVVHPRKNRSPEASVFVSAGSFRASATLAIVKRRHGEGAEGSGPACLQEIHGPIIWSLSVRIVKFAKAPDNPPALQGGMRKLEEFSRDEVGPL